MMLNGVFHLSLRGLCDFFLSLPPPFFFQHKIQSSYSAIQKKYGSFIYRDFIAFIYLFICCHQATVPQAERELENWDCPFPTKHKYFMSCVQSLILESVGYVLQWKKLFWLLMNQTTIPNVPSVPNFYDFIMLSHSILITCFISAPLLLSRS